jgi:hypothetical protein
MKIISLLLVNAIAVPCFAVKTLPLKPVGFGRVLNIAGSIQLPKENQLNKGAPSKIAVYEKDGKNWNLAEEINLNDFFSLTELIYLQKPIHLKSDHSELKLEVSLYHCPRDHKGSCVIDDFEGIAKRDPKKSDSKINLALVGTDLKKQ